jgi:hypothetical protein
VAFSGNFSLHQTHGNHVVQIGQSTRFGLPLPYQESRRAGLEPPGPIIALVEQQERVKGIVDRLAQPGVAVVPLPRHFSVEVGQPFAEQGVHVVLGVTANRRIVPVQGYVVQVVEAAENAGLGELAHPGQEHQPQVGIGVLQGRIETLQHIAHGQRQGRFFQIVEYGLVVLIDQHHHLFVPGGLYCLDEGPETQAGTLVGGDRNAQTPRSLVQPRTDDFQQYFFTIVSRTTKADAEHRMLAFPVPAGLGAIQEQAFEQLAAGGKCAVEGVDEKALSKAPWPGKKIGLAAGRHPGDVGGLIGVGKIAFTQIDKTLDADGQLWARHSDKYTTRKYAWSIVSRRFRTNVVLTGHNGR